MDSKSIDHWHTLVEYENEENIDYMHLCFSRTTRLHLDLHELEVKCSICYIDRCPNIAAKM